MTWVVLLIEILPPLIEIIGLIMEAISKKPALERPKLRRELNLLCKSHLRKVRGETSDKYLLKTSDTDVKGALEKMLERLA